MSYKKSGMVYVSLDFGKTWETKEPKNRVVLVIAPGAGMFANQAAYRELENNTDGVIVVDSGTRDNGFKYPPKWQQNQRLELTSTSTADDLLGLANTVGKEIKRYVPSLIICGSRGSQVTIGLVWRHFWRGPTLIINGGCLTTNTEIPREVYPVFLTMEHDYFKTNNVQYVHDKFQDLSRAHFGLQIHIHGQSHMPTLDPKVFLRIAIGTMERTTNYTLPKVYEVIPIRKNMFTVFNVNHEFTYLREFPTSEAGFFETFVPNHADVWHLDTDTDEAGFSMMYVDYNDTVRGWIYCKNIKGL